MNAQVDRRGHHCLDTHALQRLNDLGRRVRGEVHVVAQSAGVGNDGHIGVGVLVLDLARQLDGYRTAAQNNDILSSADRRGHLGAVGVLTIRGLIEHFGALGLGIRDL